MDFPNKNPVSQELRSAVYKWNLIKLKWFSAVKEIIN